MDLLSSECARRRLEVDAARVVCFEVRDPRGILLGAESGAALADDGFDGVKLSILPGAEREVSVPSRPSHHLKASIRAGDAERLDVGVAFELAGEEMDG